MTGGVRRIASTTILGVVVLVAGAACTKDEADDAPAIYLPARSHDAGRGDTGVLAPTDASLDDADGGPPDPFCDDATLVLCFTFDDAVVNLAPSKLAPKSVIGFDSVPGKRGRAAHLDTGSVVTFDYAPALEMSAATVEAWVNRDLTTFADDTVFDDDQRFAMTVESDGKLRCNTTTAVAKGGSVPIEQWVHVACVFDGATIKGYVDGVEVSSVTGTIGTSSTAGAALGDGAPSGGEGFAGEIDAFRVFSSARSAAQIASDAKE